jgi:hypothetical protein
MRRHSRALRDTARAYGIGNAPVWHLKPKTPLTKVPQVFHNPGGSLSYNTGA